MSFRYYPRYVKGNPQLRIFLPNFWMKLLPNEKGSPANMVTFKVPPVMTDLDVRNYLEKIYKINVVEVRTEVKCGKIKTMPGRQDVMKEDDYRLAYVKMPKDVKFTFPDLFDTDFRTEREKEIESAKKLSEARGNFHVKQNWDRSNVPTWFGL